MPVDPSSRTIGFAGLGNMGRPMVANIAAAGYRVVVYDISREVVDAVVAASEQCTGAVGAADFAEVDILITMLPNGAIVRDFLLGPGINGIPLAQTLRRGAIVIDMSSSQPTGTGELGRQLETRGIVLVDAPVSGGVPRARTGKLAIMTGGEEALVLSLQPLFGCMASSATYCGRLGAGHAMKALNNYVSAAGLVAACEALLVARKFGIDGTKAIEVLNSSTGRNNTTENKLAQYVLNEAYSSGFSLGLMRKDLAAAVELANDLKLDLPLGADLLAIWEEGEKTLGGNADHTAIAKLVHEYG